MAPVVVIRPIFWPWLSVNQIAPSAPSATPSGTLPAVGMGNSSGVGPQVRNAGAGVDVRVGVFVGVGVGVGEGVFVEVLVGVIVGVLVEVGVEVFVGVLVG